MERFYIFISDRSVAINISIVWVLTLVLLVINIMDTTESSIVHVILFVLSFIDGWFLASLTKKYINFIGGK
jgi:hypothetical protein